MPEGAYTRYHIGTPDQAWGDAERSQWISEQTKKRDYYNDVVSPLMRFTGGEVFQYGSLDYSSYKNAGKYLLYAVKSKNWDNAKPLVVVTGGVHGYETSGIHGALLFIHEKLAEYSEKFNVLVLPCVSPWGYETVNRWNPDAIDPNRSFVPTNPGCAEAANAMACILMHVQKSSKIICHTDLHETTDTDNSEFNPAKAARDGVDLPKWKDIPDGFYLVGDTDRQELEWHTVITEAVEKVTHIAPPDEKGNIIGEPAVQKGVIMIPAVKIGICGGHTSAQYTTTTEVYPDSAKATPEQCNVAQMTVVTSALGYIISKHSF